MAPDRRIDDYPCDRILAIRRPGDAQDMAKRSLLGLTVLTIGEIRKGAALRPQERRRTRVEAWLELELPARFMGRILPLDAAIADRWGLLTAQAQRGCKRNPVIDSLIAAAPPHYNRKVIPRNTGHFLNAQVQVLNPWDGQRRQRPR